MIRMSHNPALSSMHKASGGEVVGDVATYKGTAVKTVYFAMTAFASAAAVMLLLFVLLAPVFEALALGYEPLAADFNRAIGVMGGIMIGGMVVGLVGMVGSIFARRLIPVFGTIYTVGQGAVMGAMSGFAELLVPGIVFSALLATFTVFAVMSVLFFTGVIKVGQRFRSAMMGIMLSILIFSLLFMIVMFVVPSMNAMFFNSIPFLLLSIGISLVMIVVASLMILFDLSIIKEAVDNGLPKQFEWFGAFGLVVTLMWLYIEFVRLFLKLAILLGRRR